MCRDVFLVGNNLKIVCRMLLFVMQTVIICNMATVKVKFRASSVEAREGVLYYQFIHRRVVRQINPGYRIFPWEWDCRSARIVLPEAYAFRYDYLRALERRMAEDMKRLRSIVLRLERAGADFTADRVVELYRSSGAAGRGFLGFARE